MTVPLPAEAKPRANAPTLSKRGAAHAANMSPFWTTFEDLLQCGYDVRSRSGKFVNMGIANNSLMATELLEYFNSHLKLEPVDLTYGTSLFGSVRLFDAICKLYNSEAWSPVHPVLPEHIITAPGCGSILDQIAVHLADEGEAFLVAAPAFNGFVADLGTRAKAKCIPVYAEKGDGSAEENWNGATALRGFEEAMERCKSQGITVRAVILNQPNNPIGRCYDRDAVVEYGRFCERHNLFLVSDEIYALSVFPTKSQPNPTPFLSVSAIDWEKEGVDPARVCIVSSASKDFGVNGLRIGTFVCQHNPDLVSAFKATAKLAMVSSAADALWSAMLNDETFLPWFISTNRERLAAAYERCREWCETKKIPYTPSNAGHFMMVDLSAYLPKTLDGTALSASEAETTLWARFMDFGVTITPGHNYFHPTPGAFRLTFALEEPALDEGLARLERALNAGPCEAVAQSKQASVEADERSGGSTVGATAFLCGMGPAAPAKGADHDEALHKRLAMMSVAASCSAGCC